MAGKFSVYQANLVVNKLGRSVDWSVPTSYWVALFRAATDAPLRANNPASAIEVLTGTAYARVEIRGATSILFGVPIDGASTLDTAIAFAQASASWGIVTYAALMDSATLNAGNVIVYTPLPVPKAVDPGDRFTVPLGQFILAL